MTSQIFIRQTITLTLAILLTSSIAVLATSAQSLASKATTDDKLTVMTWNLSDGTNLAPLAAATTAPQFFAAVAVAYNGILATNFPERAEAIAEKIQAKSPDLIGVQEAIILRTQSPADGPATPATTITLDNLQILLDELESKGMHYQIAVVQTGADLEAPGLFPTGLVDVRLTDRDAILVREGVDLTLSNPQGGQFAAKLSLPSPLGPIAFPRSWVSIDMTFANGVNARVVSTHLEPLVPGIQVAQANELLSGPGNTALPLVLMGDFNSKADGTGTQTYANLIAAGFKDVWTILGDGDGFTCCQDVNLLNPSSTLSSRIDLVLFKGGFKAQNIDVVGDNSGDRTDSGLWPSDHAGVASKLKLKVQSS